MRIPMYLDIKDYKILILGGGYEATKKSQRFIKYGPHLTIYSMEFSEQIKELGEKGEIKLIKGDVNNLEKLEELIKENDVIIYTVPNLNKIEKKVKALCLKYRKLHIISTNAKISQIAMPVEIEIHGMKITGYSGGKSTLVVLKALEEIKRCLEPKTYLETLLESMAYLKRYMRHKKIPYKIRMNMYRKFIADKKLMEYAYNGDLNSSLSYIKSKIDDLIDSMK